MLVCHSYLIFGEMYIQLVARLGEGCLLSRFKILCALTCWTCGLRVSSPIQGLWLVGDHGQLFCGLAVMSELSKCF